MIFKKRISFKEPQITGVGDYIYIPIWNYDTRHVYITV